MSLKDCIRSLHEQKEITLEERQALERRYDALARNVASRGEARERLIAELAAEKAERERRALLTETVREGLLERFDQFRDLFGRRNTAKALRAVLENFGHGAGDDVENRRLAILAGAHTKLEELLYEYRKGVITGDKRRQNEQLAAAMENVVREAFGVATGDAKAARLAKAWGEVADGLRQRFNAAGGAIGELKNWGLPQHHDMLAVRNAGYEDWRAFVLDHLDRDRMVDGISGLRLTDDDLDAALRQMYERIVTMGYVDVEPSGAVGGQGALFKRHADHRFLHFKSPDSWLAYQKAFGEADPFAAMMGHLSTMSRDIAALELLGPNPAAMIEWAKQTALREAGLMDGGLPDLATGQRVPTDPNARRRMFDSTSWNLSRVDDMWAHISGSANAPVNARVANAMSGARSLVSANSLGSAAVSAISDQAFTLITRRFNGIPVLPHASEVVRGIAGIADKEARVREAARAGIMIDDAVHVMHQQASYAASISGKDLAGYVNDRVLAVSGLSAMTQGTKRVFGWAFQGNMAEHAGTGFLALPAPERRMLERHGIGSQDWDRIRASPLYTREGATFLRPQEIAETAGRELAERYMTAMLREMRHAVIEPTVRAKSMVLGSARPGTLIGEVMRSGVQFKSFGIAVLMLHGERMLRELSGGGIARGAQYAGGILLLTTLFGGVSLQLKELVQGRTDRDMNPLEKHGAKFWGQALLQGGGLGIYGDFLFSDVNRFGGSLAGTVTGPLVSRADNLRALTIGNALEYAEGKERSNIGRESVNALKNIVPGSSLWYARLAWERTVLDQLQYLVDPEAHKAFTRRQMTTKKERGNAYWWKPGASAPEFAK